MPVQDSANQRNNHLTDTIRRTIRVLGAQPSPVTDPSSVVSAARLVYERLLRAGVPTRWIDATPNAPLIVAGEGSIGILTYLDDSHPDSIRQGSQLPTFDQGFVHAAGIERKAGVVAAVSTLLADPARSTDLTVVIETDRHAGSLSLERWLANENPGLAAAYWEVADIPLNPPVVVRSAAGQLVVQIELTSTRQDIEPVYGGVLPDMGFALANILATLKTPDEEVRLEGFYDSIVSPEEWDFQSLQVIVPEVANWLRRIAGSERNLSTSHMTLGLFCAPSFTVRDLSVNRKPPYLAASATADIEFQLMPGQTVEHILATLQTHVQNSPFAAIIRPLLIRPPYVPSDPSLFPSEAGTLPIAPGPSPASLFAALEIPCAGYAVVGRRTDRAAEGLSLQSIAEGTRFLLSLADSFTRSKAVHS